MDSFRFNALLLEISDQLSPDHLENLKFLCRDLIGKRNLEKIQSGINLFQRLMEFNKVTPENTEYLCELLIQVKRPDLSEKLRGLTVERGRDDHLLDETEKDKLHIASDIVAENLGKHWRKLGRKLGLTEAKLECIAERHPRDLEETARELLKEWRRIRGATARSQDLISALRACQLNLTADKVEERL